MTFKRIIQEFNGVFFGGGGRGGSLSPAEWYHWRFCETAYVTSHAKTYPNGQNERLANGSSVISIIHI